MTWGGFLRLREEWEADSKDDGGYKLQQYRDSPAPEFSCWSSPESHAVADPRSSVLET